MRWGDKDVPDQARASPQPQVAAPEGCLLTTLSSRSPLLRPDQCEEAPVFSSNLRISWFTASNNTVMIRGMAQHNREQNVPDLGLDVWDVHLIRKKTQVQDHP